MQKTYEPIDEIIDNSGLKIEFIAEQMGLSRNRLYQLRVSPDKMNINQMEKFCELVGINFLDLYRIQKKFRNEVDKNTTINKVGDNIGTHTSTR